MNKGLEKTIINHRIELIIKSLAALRLCVGSDGKKALQPAIFLNLRQEIKKNVTAQYNLSKNDVYLHFKDKKDWEC